MRVAIDRPLTVTRAKPVRFQRNRKTVFMLAGASLGVMPGAPRVVFLEPWATELARRVHVARAPAIGRDKVEPDKTGELDRGERQEGGQQRRPKPPQSPPPSISENGPSPPRARGHVT